jgi:hypothetical protein
MIWKNIHSGAAVGNPGPNPATVRFDSATETFLLHTAIRLTESRRQIASLAEPPRGKPGEAADRRWLTLIRPDRAR